MKNKRSGIQIMIALLGLLGHLKYIIILAVLGGFIGNICAISVMGFGACCVATLVDPTFSTIPLSIWISLTIGAGVLRGLLRFIEQYNNHYIAFKLLAVLRDKIFEQLRILAPAKLEGQQKGALISMLTSDVETLEVFYAHTISPILIALFVDGCIVIFVSKMTSVSLGIIALISYLIIGIGIPFLSSHLLEEEGREYRKQFSESSSFFLDSIKGIQDIVLMSQQADRMKVLDQQSSVMNEKTISIKKKSAYVQAFSNLVVSLTILLTTFVGIKGTTDISYLIVALVVVFSSFGPVLSLANLPSNLTQTFASGNRILDFLEEEPVVHINKEGKTFDFERVSLEHVTFGYDEKVILEDVSLDIEKGKIIGLMGPSGCGKSTLLKLLLRFYDVNQGKIEYNGLSIQEIQTDNLYKNVTMVSQDTYLFDDTIYKNLIFVKPEATMDEVRAACQKASIDDFIMSLSKGYDTEVGLLGDGLSAGEKQRLGLARAFLSDASLVLLDEVTSNVDAINEGIILKSLKDMAKEKTIVLVSHRSSTMQICDKVYPISKGKIDYERI